MGSRVNTMTSVADTWNRRVQLTATSTAAAAVFGAAVGVAAALLLVKPSTVDAAQTSYDAPVSVWDSSMRVDPMKGIFPIGGDGQTNGNFVVASEDGVEIGIRARRCMEPDTVEGIGEASADESTHPVRDDGGAADARMLATSTENSGGLYTMAAGPGDRFGATAWDLDVHVDLTRAHGIAAGRTLGDYDLELVTDVGGTAERVDLGALSALPPSAVLFQTSRNPAAGHAPFELLATGLYRVELWLKPRGFDGNTLKAQMDVRVFDS